MWNLLLEIFKLWNERRKENVDVAVEEPDYTPPVVDEPTVDDSPSQSETVEELKWFGRFNGGRGTWYAEKNMNQYPAKFTFWVPGCLGETIIKNNGTRWAPQGQGGWVLKQSEVWGRGMGIIAPVACRKKKAYIKY